MPIKVSAGEPKPQGKKGFPKLMICENDKDKGLIVLFTSSRTGFVVKGNNNYCIGYNSNVWRMDCFTDFNEQLILQNE